MDKNSGDHWQGRVRNVRPMNAPAYDQHLTAHLINESQIRNIIGSVEELKGLNPDQHEKLIQLCSLTSGCEIAQLVGAYGPEMAHALTAGAYVKLSELLSDYMLISPRFEELSPKEIEATAAKAVMDFKNVCRTETLEPDGMVANTIKGSLAQLHAPVGALAGAKIR